MATFVLIHGGCCGGTDWEHVQRSLEKRGHVVCAPDLPGMGDDPTPLREVSLERWGRFVADLIARQTEPAILVGHSRGGIVISQAAEYLAARIKVLVYVAGMLVPSGSTQGQVSARLPRDTSFFTLSEDGISISADLDKARSVVFNTTSRQEADRALARLCPEPTASFSWPVHVTDESFGRIPRVYIETLQDNAIPVQLQRMMQLSLPCRRVITMDTDHSPAHSASQLLADHLESIADAI
jgi:pimeloyl-ACP methyl ester carboxylesterase